MIIGLRDATLDYIEGLKIEYPNGWHKTHYESGFKKGQKLPFNGVFYTTGKPRNRKKVGQPC